MKNQREYELREVGISFTETPKKLIVVFGVGIDGENEYKTFDHAIYEKDLDVMDEYDWADFKAVAGCNGQTVDEWKQAPLYQQLEDLYFYYGRLDIFGETYQTINFKQALDLVMDQN